MHKLDITACNIGDISKLTNLTKLKIKNGKLFGIYKESYRCTNYISDLSDLINLTDLEITKPKYIYDVNMLANLTKLSLKDILYNNMPEYTFKPFNINNLTNLTYLNTSCIYTYGLDCTNIETHYSNKY